MAAPRVACARCRCVRRRRHRRPMGKLAAGRAWRRRASARVRGLRALVGARASLSRRARGSMRCNWLHLDIKRQHLHSLCADRFLQPASRPAARHVHEPCAHRLCVLRRVATLATSPPPIGWQKDYDYQSPRLLVALSPAAPATCSQRRTSIGAATSTAWPRCCGATFPTKRRPPSTAGNEAGPETLRQRADADFPAARLSRRCLRPRRPHRGLMEVTGSHLAETDLAASLAEGWTLARATSISRPRLRSSRR